MPKRLNTTLLEGRYKILKMLQKKHVATLVNHMIQNPARESDNKVFYTIAGIGQSYASSIATKMMNVGIIDIQKKGNRTTYKLLIDNLPEEWMI